MVLGTLYRKGVLRSERISVGTFQPSKVIRLMHPLNYIDFILYCPFIFRIIPEAVYRLHKDILAVRLRNHVTVGCVNSFDGENWSGGHLFLIFQSF